MDLSVPIQFTLFICYWCILQYFDLKLVGLGLDLDLAVAGLDTSLADSQTY